MKLAQDAHTRAEQQVYECLWQNARPFDDVSRIITIGFGTMARLVRLSESNARINVRNLIAKMAIEESGQYNCERSVGRTYQVLNYSEILRRRREAGLIWYSRRTLGVVFVDPETGKPIELNHKPPASANPGPGLNLTPGPGSKLIPEPGPNLDDRPGLNLGPLTRETEREELPREPNSSASAVVLDALNQYGTADDEAVALLYSRTSAVCPEFTDDELVHFIHVKGRQIRNQPAKIASPIGFLLTSVPKCFAGEAFQLFRSTQMERARREGDDTRRRQTEFESWRREQQAVLDDPHAPEEEKRWARKMLLEGEPD
jgi:hypothetical protein